ncbi:Tpk3p [Rhizophagus irregularis DAOM 197198w]|uniref:Tpk3p n=2 Tax=Rhizophagus irregularis TaxID=588596 RepID=A0A015IBT3_RHIIW|nr:Tpk3p [Rhizophagus irregularis DAOM 197198w]
MKSNELIDMNIYNNIHNQFEFRKQTLLVDETLTEDERTEAIRLIILSYDRDKVQYNSGTRRICEKCDQKCLATSYCEYCLQNYLRAKFSNWTSGNKDIDNLIQTCQKESLLPKNIIEWIPYNNLQNINYLTKGGYSEIYTAIWIDGRYDEWDSKEQQLERFGRHNVILKKLENVEYANQRWFEEAKSHLTISNKWSNIIQCYGLTQDPSNGNFYLVMLKGDIDLRKYLQQNHNKLTWNEKVQIAVYIVNAIYIIQMENAVHRDLHSGNVLFSKMNQRWCISDLGFCGPADKPLNSIYGNLPYIAPEVISGKQTTKESDIYSIAMLMWEISSGQPPFINYEYDYDLAMNIINGIRPRIVSGTPLEYESLMKQCWDADPLKRPDAYTLVKKLREINLYYLNTTIVMSEVNDNLEINRTSCFETDYTSSRLFTSKVNRFENFPKPRNATEEEQEGIGK